MSDAPLAPYRVLDLTDRRGWLAGFLLAQVGADVVVVEPPGGHDRSGVRAHWDEAYNRGKRSVTVASPAELATLAADVDVVVDCGAMPFPVDLAALRAADPGLVTVSLSPFGSTGPKVDWKADDLTLWASAGPMSICGDSDRAPIAPSVPQTWMHASADAAVGALVALTARERTGFGQHVDVSAQQAAAAAAVPAVLFAPAGMPISTRVAGGVSLGPIELCWTHAVRDGYAVVTVSFGAMIGPFMTRLFRWIHEDGFCDETVRDDDYVMFAMRIARGEKTFDDLLALQAIISSWAATKTKAELLEGALARTLLIAPISTMADVLASPQLAARDYWDHVGDLRLPGPMVKASATPLPRLTPAPRAGADDATPRDRLWAQPRVAPRPEADATDRPLAGLKVADFSWVAAAPLATRALAYWGAEVVRVESSHRPCLTREALGHRDDIPEAENALFWHAVNAGKRSLALDLSKPESLEVARDLVRWADVVVEAFTPGTMAKLGLGWEQVHDLNPSALMLSSCLMGQDGPLRDFAGFGNLAATIAGFFDVTGWPDRPPSGPYLAYTDYTSPRFTLCALLAALDHRRRTGEGQYLDFSQMEAATHFLAPALVEFQRSGIMPTRAGNSHPELVPHGVYRAAGHDRWVAIVCQDDEQWRSLAIEMRRADLADLTGPERLARREELDELLETWTKRQDATGLQWRLQAHGIAAHRVQDSGDCFDDPQLTHREHFRWRPNAFARRTLIDFPAYTLSRSVGDYAWAGPTYGEHVEHVLGDLLGYDDDRITDLAIAEALE